MASICNDDWASLGVMSGHERKTLRLSAHIERAGRVNGEGVRGVAAFLDLARDPALVELVSGVIGDDLILWGAQVFCKPASGGFETPWHQDGHYWPIRPLATCTVCGWCRSPAPARTAVCG